jgi:3-methyl-2-oxobutanoate hydroxymethyltransferase
MQSQETNSNNSNNTYDRRKKVSVDDIISMKQRKEKVSVLTAYDYSTALICDKAGVDVLLVGDSAGMVMLGYSNTTPVNMEEMLLFCKAVSRATKRAMIIADMPFGSYQSNVSEAIKNAIQFIKAGCDAVKLEGGIETVETIKAIVDAGIPVMGHIGLKPQTCALWEGYKLQGKTKDSALKIISDAKSLEKAGVFSMVVELVVSEVTELVSKSVSVPIIGIGSGPSCDGQVLVVHDMLGIYEDIKPKFVKRYAEFSKLILDAISQYTTDVKSNKFPEEQNVSHMSSKEFKELHRMLKREKRNRSLKWI